ncbi:MAG: enoyl-CoA hydratase/isomerase family protein [Betaproteobacteria bacterium]|nr:MAG: enoyl-CoA hydratase/isomerase family protein [Betaproteobacteria bacterium]
MIHRRLAKGRQVSDANTITLARRGEVAWLVIDRTDKANALTAAMMAEMSAHVAACATDASVKALVLTGAGQRVFSGGVDVRTPTDLPAADARRLRSERFFELLIAVAGFAKPVITGMNGIASGGAAMIALLGDRVIAAEHAALALPEIDLGGPTLPGLAVLAYLAGPGIASDLVQSARRMPAAEALARGLVSEVATPDALDARVEQAALLLGSKPASAFALNKQWLRRPLLESLHAAEAEHRRLRASGAIH